MCQIETIPDEAAVYRHAMKELWNSPDIEPTIFKDRRIVKPDTFDDLGPDKEIVQEYLIRNRIMILGEDNKYTVSIEAVEQIMKNELVIQGVNQTTNLLAINILKEICSLSVHWGAKVNNLMKIFKLTGVGKNYRGGLVKLIVGAVRDTKSLDVHHTPRKKVPSHCSIRGTNIHDEKTRVLLAHMAERALAWPTNT